MKGKRADRRPGMRPHLRFILVSLLVVTACDDVSLLGVASGELPLVETLAEYEPEMVDGRSRIPIRWALVNRTDEILSLSVHCAVEVQRLVDDSWAHVWGTRECLLGARRPFHAAVG